MNENLIKSVDVNTYLQASIQYGHKTSEWNPQIAPYLSSEKNGFHIFSIAKTLRLLKCAGYLLQKIAQQNGTILYVGTDQISAPLVAKYAMEANAFYINSRWLGGMLTNWATIQNQINYLEELEKKEKSGAFAFLGKKEFAKQKQKIEKLNKIFYGVKNMDSLPNAIIFTNQLKDSLAVQECLKLGIPAIAIVDSNCNPSLVPYPIPANDDSSSSINFILKYLTNSIHIGTQLKITN